MNLPFANELLTPHPAGEITPVPVSLCLGIDPQTGSVNFPAALESHSAFLRSLTAPFPSLKPNLGFFLRHGSRGIALLEQFVEEFSPRHHIILDGKFGEIGNTLDAYLDFVFKTLKAHSVTINPFLGERSLDLAFEKCAAHAGKNGRVYVLCATSETGTAELDFIPRHFEKIIEACMSARTRVFGVGNEGVALAGVVAAANREEVLFSPALRHSGLSVLAPGLGAQKASHGVVAAAVRQPDNEFVFPLSRGVFEGGALSLLEMQARYSAIQQVFLTPQ